MPDKYNDTRVTTRRNIIGGDVYLFSRREKYSHEVGWVTMNVRVEDPVGKVIHFWTKETFYEYGS